LVVTFFGDLVFWSVVFTISLVVDSERGLGGADFGMNRGLDEPEVGIEPRPKTGLLHNRGGG